MTSETIRYRGYRLIIYLPSGPQDRWRASVRGPDNQLVGLKPLFQSSAEAGKAARDYVDQALDKKAIP